MMKGIDKSKGMIVSWNYHGAWKSSTSRVSKESTDGTWGDEVRAFLTTGFTSKMDLPKERDECVLAVASIINLRAGSTCDVNYKIALLAIVKEAFTTAFIASVTITFTGIFCWPLKNKDVVWVRGVVHLPGQLAT
jgi:hypothetical protein